MESFQITGATINVRIVQGRNLVAKDRHLTGRSSDPYVVVCCDGSNRNNNNNNNYQKCRGRTKVITKNCNPVWNETIQFKLSQSECQNMQNTPPPLELQIFDHDVLGNDDFMGAVQIPFLLQAAANVEPVWYKVNPQATANSNNNSLVCQNAQGDLLIAISVQARRLVDVNVGRMYDLSGQNRITVGISWDMERGKAIDLDCSCVAVDQQGQVLVDESIYYGNLTNKNMSLVHSGDNTSGVGAGDDETIMMELDRIPSQTIAVYLLLTMAGPTGLTLADLRSARVNIYDTASKTSICRFIPSELGQNTSLFLVRISRKCPAAQSSRRDWVLTPISEGDPHARDFGSLIPVIKAYTRDLVPDIQVDPGERMAIMRKGGSIRVTDYVPGHSTPSLLSMGLAWAITNGKNIDLDASAIMLDHDLAVVDLVWFANLVSRDGSIRHGGDERERDQQGDDERINLALKDVPANVKFIGFVINSYSGQELDDIANASCHLYDPRTHMDVATYTLSHAKQLDKCRALVLACLFRSESAEWNLCIISEPAQGRTVKDNVDELQHFLRRNPPQPSAALPEPDIEVSMPDAIPINEEEIVLTGEDVKHYLSSS